MKQNFSQHQMDVKNYLSMDILTIMKNQLDRGVITNVVIKKSDANHV